MTFQSLITRVFPTHFTNEFTGHRLSLWFFYALTVLTLWRSQHHLFAADGGAQSIASIPLDSFSTSAGATVVSVFALWGLSQLIVGLIYLVVCFRYRSMIPLMLLLGAFEYLMRLVYVGVFKPIETEGTAPGAAMNLPLLIILLLMFFLSVQRTESVQT